MEKKKITEEAFYIPKANVIEVEIKDAVLGKSNIKPKNGFWIKKSSSILEPKYKSSKTLLTFEEFKTKQPEIKSPFVGEDDIMYKAVYDKLTDRFLYFKNGRRNSTKISMKAAYDSYLYDNGQKMELGGNVLETQEFNYHSNIDKVWDDGDKIKNDVTTFILQGYLAGGIDLGNEIVGQLLEGILKADVTIKVVSEMFDNEEEILTDKKRKQLKELISQIKNKTDNYEDGGEIKPKEYYRVFRNSKGNDIPVKIVKGPIFDKYDYWVNGSVRGQFDTYEEAYAEIKNENFELY